MFRKNTEPEYEGCGLGDTSCRVEVAGKTVMGTIAGGIVSTAQPPLSGNSIHTDAIVSGLPDVVLDSILVPQDAGRVRVYRLAYC